MFPGTLSIGEFLGGLRKWLDGMDESPSKWTFGSLERQADGGFQDADLVGLLQTGTDNVAGNSLYS
jgi:hypothetical protein